MDDVFLLGTACDPRSWRAGEIVRGSWACSQESLPDGVCAWMRAGRKRIGGERARQGSGGSDVRGLSAWIGRSDARPESTARNSAGARELSQAARYLS